MARVHQFGSPPRLETAPAPAVAGDSVLVEVRAATVTHLDRTIASGTFGRRPTLPYIGGTQAVGVVVDGAGTGRWVRLRGAGLGITRDGCWAQWVAAPAASVSGAPSTLDPALAVALPSVATVAYVAVHEVAQVTADDTVIVTGAAGAVGAVAAQLARRAGVRRVYGVVSAEHRVADLPPGVEPVVGQGDALVEALAATGPATVAIDTVGGPVLEALLRAGVAPGGRVAALGHTAGTEITLDLPDWLLADVALLPVNMLRRGERSAVALATVDRLAAEGELTVPVERVGWSGFEDAMTRLQRGDIRGRLVLCPHDEQVVEC
ncbi:zinc-binding alcohol dehydrogenase family protein [Micromonospora sp. NPDC048830]|uniref:quinone oxidoreductase family protein n=1 Tax=Micromonospora sp. NPDC048830 TaxID=3364257 RepID=UPI00371D3E8C